MIYQHVAQGRDDVLASEIDRIITGTASSGTDLVGEAKPVRLTAAASE